MAVNKVVINDEVVLDLTGDTVQAADLPKGVIAHSAAGVKVTGTTNYAGSSNAGGSATSAEKLNNSLTIKLNGTSQGAWDGSSAKTIDITAATPAAVKAAIAEAKLAAWPIGSIYMTVNSTSPANLFGGTWERISDCFLLGASSSYPAGSTGGEFTHKLTQSELPNYSLSVTNGSNVIRSKTGSTADAYVQTQSSGWGIPNWESKTVTVASGGSGAAHNNMPPYLSVWIWKRTK
jgi:hypothetical protein|nr:MAG TPA: baseplate protein [Caudoviricetes sp.]